MKQPNNEADIFSEQYWNRFFLRLLMYLGVFGITVTVIGVLATPIIMSLVYSWMWMFLYLAYLVIVLLTISFWKCR